MKIEIPVVVKSANPLDAIVAENPLTEVAPDHSRVLVAFAANARALSRPAAIKSRLSSFERFALGKRAAYLYCASGLPASKAGAAILGKIGSAATTRNWATVLKLRSLAIEFDA